MLNGFVERDGLARSVLFVLAMTTIACFAYTWGYYEGIHNSKTLIVMERIHNEEVAAAALRPPGSDPPRKSFSTGHGLHSVKNVDKLLGASPAGPRSAASTRSTSTARVYHGHAQQSSTANVQIVNSSVKGSSGTVASSGTSRPHLER